MQASARPTIASSSPSTFWLDADPRAFQNDFERVGFAFPHRLAHHPLFALEPLIELAKTLPDIVYDAGDVRVDQRWDEVPLCDMPPHVLIEKIETSGAWILLKHANKRPGYREVFEECMSDVEQLSGRDLSPQIKAKKAIVFVNSPNRVTPYHIDHQSSCLLQISGRKTISIFDPTDREVLPETELERFWARDDNAAIYKRELQSRATVIELTPGMGVHIPVNAPHWVQNGPEVSVSLNFNFDYHDHMLADIYRANYRLRRMGFTPTPPGKSALRDAAKTSFYGLARTLRKVARPNR
jgi:hypothetical protein